MINIHNLVSLEIDDAFPWRNDWLSWLGDIPEMQPEQATHPKARIRLIYDRALPIQKMRKIGDGIYVQKKAVFDEKYRLLMERDTDGALILRTDNPCVEWLFWSVQLALLSVGSTFVHGAGAEKDGRAILFASWGGIGKTALVAGLINNLHWKLLGDDLIIVNADGSCLSYPKPMVLYSYHKSVFPELFDKGKGPIAPVSLNETLSKVALAIKPILRSVPNLLQFARRHNPQSVRLNPSEVFGMHNIASEAKLDHIIWLDRVNGINAPELHADDGTLASRMMGCTIQEFDTRCNEVINVAMGVGIIDSESVYAGWIHNLQKATQSCRKHIMYLPAEMPVNEVPDAVAQLLDMDCSGLVSTTSC